MVKLARKGYFRSKTEKSEACHCIMGIRISQSTTFQLKLTIFDLLDQICQRAFTKEYLRSQTEKSHFCMSLVNTLKFSAGCRQTQQYFNVSFTSSHRSNKNLILSSYVTHFHLLLSSRFFEKNSLYYLC